MPRRPPRRHAPPGQTLQPPAPRPERFRPSWYEDHSHWTHLTTHRIGTVVRLLLDGMFRVPPFQRPWCWTDAQIAHLFDSMRHGYHFGSILVWDRYGLPASSERFGEVALTSEAGRRLLVIDGQQRLGAIVTAHSSGRFYFDMMAGQIAVDGPGPWRLPTRYLFSWNYNDARAWIDAHVAEHRLDRERVHAAWVACVETFEGVEVPFVVLPDNFTVARVVESFRRLNTSGTPMDVAELERILTRWEDQRREAPAEGVVMVGP